METRKGGRNGAQGAIFFGRNRLATRARLVLEAMRGERVSEEAARRLLCAAQQACSRALKERELDAASRVHLREHRETILYELMKGCPPSRAIESSFERGRESRWTADEARGTVEREGRAAGGAVCRYAKAAAEETLDELEPLERRTVRFTLGELRTLRATSVGAARSRVAPIGMRPFGERASTVRPARDPWWDDGARDAPLLRLGAEPPEGVGVLCEVRAADRPGARALLEHGREAAGAPRSRVGARNPEAIGTVLIARRQRCLKEAFLVTLGHPDGAMSAYGLRLAAWTASLPDTLELRFEATLWSPLVSRLQLVLLAERAWNEHRPLWGARPTVKVLEKKGEAGEVGEVGEAGETNGTAAGDAMRDAA